MYNIRYYYALQPQFAMKANSGKLMVTKGHFQLHMCRSLGTCQYATSFMRIPLCVT